MDPTALLLAGAPLSTALACARERAGLPIAPTVRVGAPRARDIVPPPVELVRLATPMVEAMAERFAKAGGGDVDELWHEGLRAALEAGVLYSAGRGTCRFPTFVRRHVAKALFAALEAHVRAS